MVAIAPMMDGLACGFHEQRKPQTLAEFRAVFPGPLMGNCGTYRKRRRRRLPPARLISSHSDGPS